MIDPDLLRRFMHTFYGYGSWSAPLWFVGMEEGGGTTPEEVQRRLNAWRGGELEDLRDFHLRAELPMHFVGRPRIQALGETWFGLPSVLRAVPLTPRMFGGISRRNWDEQAERPP